jgi:hypothetical protein
MFDDGLLAAVMPTFYGYGDYRGRYTAPIAPRSRFNS